VPEVGRTADVVPDPGGIVQRLLPGVQVWHCPHKGQEIGRQEKQKFMSILYKEYGVI